MSDQIEKSPHKIVLIIILALVIAILLGLGWSRYIQSGKYSIQLDNKQGGMPNSAPGRMGGSSAPAGMGGGSATLNTTAVQNFMGQLQEKPNDVLLLYSVGTEFMHGESWKEAAGFMNKVIAIDPKHIGARRALFMAYLRLGQYTDAEKEALFLVESDPKDELSRYNLAMLNMVYLGQEGHDKGELMLREMIKVGVKDDNLKASIKKELKKHNH